MISFRSVKFRLTLWYAIILAVLLSIFSFFMYTEFSRVLYRDVDQSLELEAKSFQDSMQSYLTGVFRGLQIAEERQYSPFAFFYTPEIRIRLLEVIRDWEKTSDQLRRSNNFIRFLGVDHTEMLTNLKGWEQEIIFPDYQRDNTFMETGQSYQTIHFKDRPIRLYYHLVRYKGRPLFIIQCGKPIYEVANTLNRLAFIILISIPGAVFAACLAGLFLARRSFRPVDSMIREARQITAAYLKGRLPRTQTGDEVDRLAETLNEMIDRLEESTRAIQDLSSDVSHELKTPLAIIRGEIDLALRKSRSPEELKQTLGVIGEEVNGLIRLVDDLMLLVRSDAKQLKFEKNPVSLKEVLSYVFSRFQDRGIEKGIEMILDADTDVEVLGDSLYLKRLISNLFDNAIKFTPSGGRITVSLSSDPSHAVVQVLDTGMGMDAEIQEKVFARFYRTDQARSKEGSGLGLNIVKAISDAHGGRVSIEAQPSQGTCVTLLLPLR